MESNLWLIVVICVAVTYFVVFVERGQRRVLVNYAKRQVGNKVYGGQASHLPLKLNMAGVIPPIFASSIILFPATIAGWFTAGETTSSVTLFIKDLAATLSPGQPVYILMYALAIIFFCFFYTAMVFNSRDTADNLKKSGAFVPGIRPGDQTARYVKCVEAGGDVEGAAVGVRAQRDAFSDQGCILPNLTGNEDCTHHVRNHEPLD